MNLPTLLPNQPELLERGIDRLFVEFLAMYGRHWLDLWMHCDVDVVKASWAAALRGIDGEAIHLALDALRTRGNPFPPTQPEFVALCRQFVRQGPRALYLVDKRKGAGPKDGFDSLRDLIR